VVGAVAYVYMCGFLVELVRLCFGFVYLFVYIYVLFSVLVCFIVFCISVFFVLGCNSLAPNDDIVRFRCGGMYPFPHIFMKNFHIFV